MAKSITSIVSSIICSFLSGLKDKLEDTYARKTHNHDTSYSAINHNHDSSYSAINHNHDTSYSSLNHTHSDYAASSHNHDTSYAALNHTHNNYASSSHTHTAVNGYTVSVVTALPASPDSNTIYFVKE